MPWGKDRTQEVSRQTATARAGHTAWPPSALEASQGHLCCVSPNTGWTVMAPF